MSSKGNRSGETGPGGPQTLAFITSSGSCLAQLKSLDPITLVAVERDGPVPRRLHMSCCQSPFDQYTQPTTNHTNTHTPPHTHKHTHTHTHKTPHTHPHTHCTVQTHTPLFTPCFICPALTMRATYVTAIHLCIFFTPSKLHGRTTAALSPPN